MAEAAKREAEEEARSRLAEQAARAAVAADAKALEEVKRRSLQAQGSRTDRLEAAAGGGGGRLPSPRPRRKLRLGRPLARVGRARACLASWPTGVAALPVEGDGSAAAPRCAGGRPVGITPSAAEMVPRFEATERSGKIRGCWVHCDAS